MPSLSVLVVFYLLFIVYFVPSIKQAAGTNLHCTPPTNAPTPRMRDYHKSLTISYALELCSFPWLSAAQDTQNITKGT